MLQIVKTQRSVTVGFTGYSAYAPTKYAVRGLADTLRNEVGATTDLLLAWRCPSKGCVGSIGSPKLCMGMQPNE